MTGHNIQLLLLGNMCTGQQYCIVNTKKTINQNFIQTLFVFIYILVPRALGLQQKSWCGIQAAFIPCLHAEAALQQELGKKICLFHSKLSRLNNYKALLMVMLLFML